MVCLNSSLLIIESSVENSTIYQNYLRSTGSIYNLSIVTSIAEGLDLCRTSTIDTVLLGGSISDLDGLAFLESLAAQSGIDRPTVIIVATEGDPRIAVRAIKLGAQDYLLERDLTPELLHSALQCAIEKARLQLQLQECNDRFRIAIDNVLDSMAIFSAIRDQTGQIIDFCFDYLNPSALASNQMTAADTHRSLCEIFPSVRETGLFGNYCRVVETGEPLVQDNLIYSDTFGAQYLTKVYDLRVVKLDDGVVATWREITDRKQTEIALQESEERLRLTIESAKLGTVDFNLLTGQVIWNATAEVFMGYVPGAAATYTYADFEARVHPDDRANVNADLARATVDSPPERLRQRPDSTSEFRVILPDGSIRWLCGFGRFYDDDGRAVRMLGTIEDITAAKCAQIDRQQAEDELRQAQALAQSQLMEIEAIYQTAPIGLAIIDGDLRFRRVNQTLAEINGIAIDDHIGRTVREVVPDFADEVEPLFRRILETGEALLNLEISGETKAQPGVCRTWIENWYPLQDETGRNIGINVVVQEITERKIAETALIESEEQFRTTFEQAAIGITHVSLDGRWLLFNSKLCEICGYTPAELLNGYFQDITHPDDLDLDREIARQMLANEIQSIKLDKRYIHKLGHIVWINLTSTLRRDPSGAPLYFITSIEDISHRKHAEFALQAQAVKLAETTALVELRNQELNRFSHTVSHDLKAPLRGISNLAAWISDDLPPTIDPDILANLELMRTRISRMDSLIDGSLEYARVGSTAASLATFSVEQLLAEIVDSLSIPDSFVVELPAELPPITTNRVLLSQVLANLIGNAYKHHDRPDGRIQVTAQPDAEMWGFSVTDDGHGIAPANQAEVFDIFRTLSGNDKNSTGIGLSIVKKLVETHGGKITLESQLGMGTTFNFTWIAEL